MPLLAKCTRLSAKHAPPSKRRRSAAPETRRAAPKTRRDAYSSYAKLHTLPPILFYFWNFRDIYKLAKFHRRSQKYTSYSAELHLGDFFTENIPDN